MVERGGDATALLGMDFVVLSMTEEPGQVWLWVEDDRGPGGLRLGAEESLTVLMAIVSPGQQSPNR